MPEFNLIQRPDLVLRLQQFLGLRQAHVTPALGEVVVPVVLMGDVRDEGSPRPTERNFWHQTSAIAGGALEFSVVLLRNPAGSGTVITVREIRCQGGGAVVHSFGLALGLAPNNADTPALNVPQLRNTRPQAQPFTTQARGVLSSDSNVAVIDPPPNFIGKHLANEEVAFDLPDLVIVPGMGLFIWCLEATTAVTVSVLWDEESLEIPVA